MRRWRTTEHENGVHRRGFRPQVSLCGTSIRGERLLEGRSFSVTTQIPQTRLTRVGKGITFCRTWKQEGRMTVSAPDRRRNNRLRWSTAGQFGRGVSLAQESAVQYANMGSRGAAIFRDRRCECRWPGQPCEIV